MVEKHNWDPPSVKAQAIHQLAQPAWSQEQHSHHEVHSLAVADHGVSASVSSTDLEASAQAWPGRSCQSHQAEAMNTPNIEVI